MEIRLEKAANTDANSIFDIQVKAFNPLFNPLLDQYKDYDTNPANETIERVLARIDNPDGEFYKVNL